MLHEMKARQKGLVTIAGAFRPNGGSAIDNTLNKGVGYTVARSGTGVYTVTLESKFVDLVGALAGVRLNALANTFVQPGAIDVVTAKTFVINAFKVVSAGAASDATLTAIDIASHANNWIDFVAFVKRTSVNR